MSNEVDQAQELEAMHRRESIKKVLGHARVAEQSSTCIECGEPIPQKRRQASPGTPWCVECAG